MSQAVFLLVLLTLRLIQNLVYNDLTLLNAINWNIYARALTGVRWSRFVFIQSPSLNHRGVRAI